MKRYNFDWPSTGPYESPSGPWVKHHEAYDLLQDERDKLHRIQQVAQVAYDHWPHDMFRPAIVTILQICKDGKASPITKEQTQ